jgi:hypothetical protein
MRIFCNLREKMSIFMPRHGLASSVAKVKQADNRANGADNPRKNEFAICEGYQCRCFVITNFGPLLLPVEQKILE